MSFFSLTSEPTVYKPILTYLLTYLFNYLLTHSTEQSPPWEPDISQLFRTFPAYYGTWMFITVFTSACHLFLSWTISNQSMPPHPTSCRPILILSSHLRLGFPSGLFPSGFPTKTLHTPLPHMCYMPYPSHSSQFDHPINVGWGVKIMKFPII